MTRALYDRIDAIESFAADVAHELKNPLTSLKSALEMYARTPDGSDRERMAELIRSDLKRIDRLISEISDASRLDAELSREHAESVDMALLLETLVTGYRATEIPRGVAVVISVDHDRPMIVQGLDQRLGQVFRNLVDNAISFSPERGTVHVNATARGGILRVLVDDQGPGIPPDNWTRCSTASTPNVRPNMASAAIRGWAWRSRARSWNPRRTHLGGEPDV